MVLSRKIGQLASRFPDKKRRLAEEDTDAAAIKTAARIEDWVKPTLRDVAHVPLLGYNLLSLKIMVDHDYHKYNSEKKGAHVAPEKRKYSFWCLGRKTYLSFQIPLNP